MKNLPKEKQSVASFTLPSKKPDRLKFFLFLGLGLAILVLIGEGVYWLKLNKEKKLLTKEAPQQAETEAFWSEEQLSAAIIRIYGGEQSVDTDILKALEEAKEYDPEKFPEDLEQYTCYTIILSRLMGKYYASGDKPEKRDPEILKVLAQIKGMAWQNSHFEEEHWKIEGVDSY